MTADPIAAAMREMDAAEHKGTEERTECDAREARIRGIADAMRTPGHFRKNITPSLPPGYYRRVASAPVTLKHGDLASMILSDFFGELTPQAIDDFLRHRDDVPAEMRGRAAEMPIMKVVAALPGDRVRAEGGCVWVNGALVAERFGPALVRVLIGYDLPNWSDDRPLRDDEVFLLADPPHWFDARQSYDSRYFGPFALSKIEGVWEHCDDTEVKIAHARMRRA